MHTQQLRHNHHWNHPFLAWRLARGPQNDEGFSFLAAGVRARAAHPDAAISITDGITLLRRVRTGLAGRAAIPTLQKLWCLVIRLLCRWHKNQHCYAPNMIIPCGHDTVVVLHWCPCQVRATIKRVATKRSSAIFLEKCTHPACEMLHALNDKSTRTYVQTSKNNTRGETRTPQR